MKCFGTIIPTKLWTVTAMVCLQWAQKPFQVELVCAQVIQIAIDSSKFKKPKGRFHSDRKEETSTVKLDPQVMWHEAQNQWLVEYFFPEDTVTLFDSDIGVVDLKRKKWINLERG